jgi:hypothetical protein
MSAEVDRAYAEVSVSRAPTPRYVVPIGDVDAQAQTSSPHPVPIATPIQSPITTLSGEEALVYHELKTAVADVRRLQGELAGAQARARSALEKLGMLTAAEMHR